ncbi:7SK snRNA methylphosphate capping enzyme [Nelusetta ayraudi]|uniref:7SK snRNA methylphosphate capping enzyme n=1 Tax=Nelusetta ayraudi TaxID=303726 RepID=UPI003F71F3B1
MSVDEDTVKTGSPQASPASSLQLSECTIGGYGAAAATPDFDSAACPVPNQTGHGWRSGSRGSEPNHRRNPFHLSTQEQLQQPQQQQPQPQPQPQQQQQQQQQMSTTSSSRLMKRRNTANSAFKHPHAWGKRRRRANSESDSLLPTNFYLGGNINDPLNLNSLLDEEVSRALNAETPKSSPLPARSREPVEILIPRDITDPLNLNGGAADDASVLVAPARGGGGGGRRRHRNRHHGGGGGAGGGGGGGGVGGGGGGGGGGEGATAAHVTLLEAGGSEGVSTAPPLPPHNLGKDSSGPSGSGQDSRERCSAEEAAGAAAGAAAAAAAAAAVVALPESTPSSAPWPPGGAGQHGGRRKRRRNSGKTEQPATQPPLRWSGAGDKARRTGPGGRQYPQQQQQQQQQKKKFQFGNYNKYYGYRNPSNSEDPRVRLLRPEWFEGKEVLDLGCNSGHLTLYVAKRLRPARILGLDIDGGLIHAARKNIRHYLSEVQTQEARSATQCTKQEERNGNKEEENHLHHHDDSGHQAETAPQQQDDHSEDLEQEDCRPPPAGHSVSCSFPVSLRISRGPIAAPPLAETPAAKPGEFPCNVSFIKANYVLDSDHLVLTQRPEYDVIMCLSVTKWVHLNWGDGGLRRLFKRVFKHLRPGGLFLLEPQPWESYVRRKKLTDNISKNYHSIRLKPDQFPSYLTTEVGFTSFEYLGAPKCSMRGFQRPIYLFSK